MNNFFYEYPNLLTTLKETTSQGKLDLKRYCFSLQIVGSGRTPIGIMAEQNVALERGHIAMPRSLLDGGIGSAYIDV